MRGTYNVDVVDAVEDKRVILYVIRVCFTPPSPGSPKQVAIGLKLA